MNINNQYTVKTILVLLSAFVLSPLYAAVGDVFEAWTVEGILMTFKVISEGEKTCQVGDGRKRCISTFTKGAITIPASVNEYTVTSIEVFAFQGCSGLTSVTIPNSVTSIGSSAFSSCRGLTSILVDSNNTYYDSRDNCNAIIETASNTLIAGCMTSVIPNSVTTIGNGAFWDCSGLTSVTIPNSVTTIGGKAFQYCSGLTSITIPNSVTSIGSSAFCDCSGLTSVTIPNSVTTIGSYAFYLCSGLTSIDSYIKKPFSIYTSVFGSSTKAAATLSVPYGQKALYEQTEGWDFTHIVERDVEVGDVFTEKTVENIDMMFMVTDMDGKTCQVASNLDGETAVAKTTEGTLTIPSTVKGFTVTAIGAAAFKDCENLTSVFIPNTITAIGNVAFEGCSGLTNVVSYIKKPFSVSAFASSTKSAATLSVPYGSKTLYEQTDGWKDFTHIDEQEMEKGDVFTAKTIENVNMMFMVTDVDGKTCQVTIGLGSETAVDKATVGTLTIPSTAKGYTVTEIAQAAFKGCESLTGIFVPSTITAIGDAAFEGCRSLASIQWESDKAIPSSLMEDIGNPNLLLYVRNKDCAPTNIQNVVVDGVAEKIVLKEAFSGNNFYCIEEFTAQNIEYTHNYSMTSGYKTCQGWETIVLPFDVTSVAHESDEELVPIKTWELGSPKRPFWLYKQTTEGWKTATAIQANTPYIICMPNNQEQYAPEYCITGSVTFKGNNVKVAASDKLSTVKYGDRIFVPNYQNLSASSNIYALNVNNEWDKYDYPTYRQGSTFIPNLRGVRPFECYMTTGADFARDFIPIFGDEEVTGIMELPFSGNGMNSHDAVSVYTLTGVQVASDSSDAVKRLPKGIYIINGRQRVVK